MASNATTHLLHKGSRFANHPLFPFALGGLTGTAAFLWIHQLLATFGTSLAVTTALTLVIAGAIAAGVLFPTTVESRSWRARAIPAAWLLLGLSTATLTWQMSSVRWVVGLFPATALASEATAFSLLLLCFTPLLGVPVAAGTILASLSDRHSTTPCCGLPQLFVLGVGAALIAGPTVIAPFFGLQSLSLIVTLAAAAGFWVAFTRPASSVHGVPMSASRGTAVRWSLGVSLLIGFMLPIVSRLTMNLMPGSPFEHYSAWSGLILGIAFGSLPAVQNRLLRIAAPSSDAPLIAALAATIWPTVLLCLTGVFTDALLSLNASVSSVPLIMLSRIGLAAVATLPLGVAVGQLWWRSDAGRQGLNEGVMALAVGIALARTISISPITALPVLIVAAMICGVIRFWALGLPSLSRPLQLAGVVCVLSVATLPFSRSRYQPERSARLLFSTQTFAALHSGIERSLLPHLDDGRLVALSDRGESTWTIWKHRGSQLALRENGLPRGIVSIAPETSPQFAGEVMPAVVPTILHARPQSVLLLGVGSTATLSSLLACPVTSVTCVERDAELIRLIDDVIAPATGTNPLDDVRVRLLNIDPTLALLGDDQQYDILILSESQASIMRSASRFTAEYYAAARQKLNSDGILCQRLQYADFGRQPIEDLLATMRSVFPTVALLDSAPGEMLVIATLSDAPLVNESTIDRCQTPHIRNLMAQVGWDWSVLLNVGALSPDSVTELTADRGTPNTVANGRFAFGLPQEVMRWSPAELPKWVDRQQLLNAHASRMLTWVGESERVKEVQERLADVIEQQRLISENPDQFWAYRKTLKERLTERPRGVIKQVKHEGLKRSRHPEDQRRMDYLEVLGEAAGSHAPAAESIRELARFAVPYDPLVSYFLHQESARLYEKSPDDDPDAQYHHLRYSVFFGPPNDRSVRNVISALTLINDHPELVSDPVARWDEMNALLDVLKQRSDLRLNVDQNASSFELIDAERSINVARRSMETMDSLRERAGIPEDDWSHRKIVLERMLVRPMWKYHSQQAARLAKRQAQAEAVTAERDGDSKTR